MTSERDRARRAGAALTAALLEAARQRLRPHCSDPATHRYWLSESVAERRVAAQLCLGCPVFDPCGKAAEARRETWRVWASKDYSRKPGRRKAKT